MKNVHMNCYGAANEDCSRQAHKDIGLKYADTEKCVKNSFTNSQNSNFNVLTDKDSGSVKNTLIEKEMDYMQNFGPAIFPSIVINN